MKKFNIHTILNPFTSLLLITCLAGPATLAQDTHIRVIHLSPDAQALDVLLDGSLRVVTNLQFPLGINYLNLEAGIHTFDVVPVGRDIDASIMTFSDLPLAADTSYTAVAYNTLDSLSSLVLVDDYDVIPDGQNRLRAIHTAVGVNQVDIWLIPEMGLAYPLWENVDFGAAGNALDFPAAAMVVGIDVDDDAAMDFIFDVPALTAGTSANVFAATDSMGSLFLNVQLMDGSTVRIDPRSVKTTHIRVIHLSPDTPIVDILVNDTLRAITDLKFTNGTNYLDLDAGTYTFDVVPAGGTIATSLMTIPDLLLATDTYYTAVAYNELADLSSLTLVDDYNGIPSGQNRLRVIHTAVGFGQVDVWLIPETTPPMLLSENVDFGAASNALDVPATAMVIGLDVNNDAIADVVFDVPALQAGTITNVFAVTDSMGALFLNAFFMDGSTTRMDPRICPAFGVDLFVPEGNILAGDPFFVISTTCNPGAPVTLPFFALLDVGTGEYWFYPSWVSSTEAIDYMELYVDSGVTAFAVIPDLVWPDTGNLSLDVHFFGALLSPEMTEIIGMWDMETVHIGM